ncbi:hypothetical protein PFLU3_10080 [Pseudomonas fluorescens]|uniref:Uncharacterized protein n=1 Tax=Pseudomonas fluorescens TaxID=294 RepID=A0A0D0TKF3_PSEFL|nr:hypothetical protein C4K02_4388 [Pseudomonas synxantha]KIR23656.1 hypothetical protein PFLU3_10080 [Pseudomonas fluorescens]
MFKRMFLRMPIMAAQSGYRCFGFICKKNPILDRALIKQV